MKYTLKDFWRQFTDTLYVHLLWVLVSFLGLLITFGASTTALFKVMYQIFKTEEPTQVSKLFFETFKKDFIESTCVWLLILIFATPLAWMLVYAFQKPNDWLMVIGIVIGYQLLMFTLYVFPVIAVFKSKSIISTIKNVLILQNSNLLTNLKLIGSLVIFVAGMMWLHGSFIFLLIPCYGFLVSFHLKSAFAPYIAQFKITIEEKENDNELLNI